MAIQREWNPHNGTWYEEDFDKTSESLIVHHKQDVQPILDRCKEERNSGLNDKAGDFSHYCTIPPVVQTMMLQQHGVNIHDKKDFPKVVKLIETEYPGLKTTNLKHAL